MAKTDQDFSMYAGEDKTLRVTTYDSAGQPQDIQNNSIEWAVRDRLGASAKLLEKTTGGGGIMITDATAGVFEIYLDSADTNDLDADLYVHEARLTDPASNETTILTGTMTLLDSAFV